MLMSVPSQAGIRPGTVLLLEDSEPDSGSIYQTLQSAGFDARHHRIDNVSSLITALDSQKWDAVVSQFQMPGFSGCDALRVVRSMGQDIPFFFVCEKLGEVAAIPAFNAGADDCIARSDLAQLVPALTLEIAHSTKRTKYKMAYRDQVAEDFAVRQNIETRLSNSETAWRLMFDSSPVAQMLQLPFGNITSVNDRLLELSGYERHELVGRTAEEANLRVDDELGRQFLHTMKTQGHADELELNVRRKDGAVRKVTISSRSLVLEGTTYRLHSFVDITDKTKAEEASRVSQQALMSTSQGVLISGPDRLTMSVNPAFEAMTGYTQQELSGQPCSILQGPKTSPETVSAIRQALDTGQSFFGELVNYRKDGSMFWNELSINPVFAADGRLTHFVGIQRDITKLKTQQIQLKLSAQIFAQGHESVIVADADGFIVMVNQAFCDTSGYSQSEMLAKNLRMLSSPQQGEAFHREMWDAVNTTGRWTGPTWSMRKDGTEYPEQLTISLVRNESGTVCNYVCTSNDTSEQQAAQKQIAKLSHFDTLTGLPNRVLLADRCSHDISKARREGKPVAMMVLGLDFFSVVNDTLGHFVGDQVLKQFVHRIVAGLRDQDTVSRVGGDEFVLVLPGTSPEGASLLAAKLLHLVAKPFQVSDTEVSVTMSAGIAIFPANGEDFETLFKSAGVAMHQAKNLGRDKYRFFSAEMFDDTLAQVALLSALRAAIAQNQLRLNYQPFVDLQTGQIAGMEALLRWQHPELGAVSPARFIPVAEQSGLIGDIGLWVLRQTCMDMRDWLSKGIDVQPISINVSPLQFRDAAFPQQVGAALQEFGIDPSRLCVEVTEGALMENVERSEAMLRSLKKFGVTLALDDFGTGYSSLSYLKQFPFDKVKIDQSFVCNINNTSQDAVITKVIISMAHGLGLRVVAEGVETEAQCEFLRTNVCDEIQGYFFSRPVPKHDMEALLVADKRLPAHLVRLPEKTRTLLLVDDEPNVIASLKRVMRRDGYRTLTASNADEALALLTRNPVDVIVTDQRMPGMTGVELLRRAKAICPETIRLVLSGYAELQPVTDAINDGTVYRFLTKPWDDEQLRSFINEAFHHKELADENRQLNLKILTADQQLATCRRQLQELLGPVPAQEVAV